MNDNEFNKLAAAVKEGVELLREREFAVHGANMPEAEYEDKLKQLENLMSYGTPEDPQEHAELSERIERLAIMCEAWEQQQDWYKELMESAEEGGKILRGEREPSRVHDWESYTDTHTHDPLAFWRGCAVVVAVYVGWALLVFMLLGLLFGGRVELSDVPEITVVVVEPYNLNTAIAEYTATMTATPDNVRIITATPATPSEATPVPTATPEYCMGADIW